MREAGQPIWLRRTGPGLVCAGLLLAALLALFLVAPIGASKSVPATTPTANSSALDVPESAGPKTWVLSSTVVTSTPSTGAPDATQAEADVPRPTVRSTPLIIQVPADGPTTQPATTPAVASPSAITGTTAPAADVSSPTCSALEPERARADRISIPPGGVGSSDGRGNALIETACAD